MTIIKYIDPNTKLEVIEDLEVSINVPEYIQNLHKNFLCKDICTGENCKVWMFRNDDWTLLGVPD
jgi:hypothetical protein